MSVQEESNDCFEEQPSEIISVSIPLGKIDTDNSVNGMSEHQHNQSEDVKDSTQNKIDCQQSVYHNSNEYKMKLKEIIGTLSEEREVHSKSLSFLSLAELSKCPCLLEEFYNDDNFAQIMSLVAYRRSDTGTLLFCKVLFLSLLTHHRLSMNEGKNIEALLLEFLKALTATSDSDTNCDIHLHALPGNLKKKSAFLCDAVTSSVDVFNTNEINVTYLCLKVVKHLSSKVSELNELEYFSSLTMFQVLEKFHACIMSPAFNTTYNLTLSDGVHDFRIAMICQCLQIFEMVFHNSQQKMLLNYKDNFFLKCICRHLSFCIKALFPKDDCIVESADDIDFEKKTSVVPKYIYLHQTCLISILKVLLNVHPNFDFSMYDITSSLMEKLLICFLETSYSSLDCKFELCLMTLELMVNLIEFELVDRKHFAKMCLMKFSIGKFTYLSVEILIKILICSLKRVITLGSLKNTEENETQPSSKESKEYFDSVYHVAEEHMEHSFICSYICVFLSYFCDIKDPFFTYVYERISVDMAETAIIVMGKFKEFIPLMSKQNGKAFDMLDRAIRIFLGMIKERA